jgi:SPX domain protein involved in polyphosphate accumulation
MDVFRRRELKFLINEQQRQLLEQEMRQRMVPDKHGRNTICNLYYDTPDYRLIRRSLERPVYKEKLRLRSYGKAVQGADVFLEMKKKYKGIVYKRRIRVTEAEAKAFMERRADLPKDSQIARELVYFRDFYRELEPRVYLSYEREA